MLNFLIRRLLYAPLIVPGSTMALLVPRAAGVYVSLVSSGRRVA